MRTRNYVAVAAISFAERIAYRGEALIALAVAAARIGLAAILWGAVFADLGVAERGGEAAFAVSGFTLPMMLTYYLIAAFLRAFNQSDGLVWEFAAEIRAGTFGKYLVRPVDPLHWFLSSAAGRTLFHAGLALAAAGIVFAMGRGTFTAPDPVGLALMIPVALLGLSALALLDFMTALLAFRFMDISAFHMVKGNLVELLSGALVPLAVMPGWAQAICAMTPFPALISLPAELWLGRGRESFGPALLGLIAWNVALYILARTLFASLSARYEEVGS